MSESSPSPTENVNDTADRAATFPTEITLKTAGGGYRMMAWIGWAGFFFCFVYLMGQFVLFNQYFDNSGGTQERFHSGNGKAKDKIAIISISGVIMSGEGYVKQQIDRVRKDDSVKAVVLRLNTPGGTVAGSDYIYHHLKKLRKDRKIPIVVSMGSMAASGGYYVAMAVGDQPRSIFAEPTSTTGSIGVIIPHYDISGLLEDHKIADDSIMSHERKRMLTMTRKMKPEHRQILQGYVDQSFARFKEVIHEGRPAYRSKPGLIRAPGSDRDLATGEIFTAPVAKEYGLIDEIGFIEDAIDRAKELAEIGDKDVRVVKYNRPNSLMNLAGFVSSEEPDRWQQTLELTTPRAYFLTSSLTPLVSTLAQMRR